MDDIPWLEEMLEDDELELLFTPSEEELQRTVRLLIQRAADDTDLESRLVDMVDLSLEHRNDATNATLWAAVVLGEIRSRLAIGTLQRCLAAEHDEMLQDAAIIALLRIGSPALESVMDTVEEDSSAVFRRSAYSLLGLTPVLKDDLQIERVAEFLKSRIGLERHLDVADQALEELFSALAHLGRRDALELMKKALEDERYRGRNAVLQDAVERLEENSLGTPFVGNLTPWEERYGWLFEDARDQARVLRGNDDDDSDDSFLQGLGQRPVDPF